MASFFRSGRFDDRGAEIGVWRNNRAGLWFLDWFAEHRCTPGDELWAYCKHAAQRWPWRGVDLFALVPSGQLFDPSETELDVVFAANPDDAQLLLELAAVTSGEWTGTADSELPHSDAHVEARLDDVRKRSERSL